MGVSMDDAAEILWEGRGRAPDRHRWGTVKAVNADGTLEVSLNASATTTTCSKTCEAAKGDRVLVLVLGTGAVAIGRKL